MRLPIEFATARVDVDLVDLEPFGAFPQVPTDVEEHDDGKREVCFEEGFCVERLDGDVELMTQSVGLFQQDTSGWLGMAYLSNEHEDDNRQSDPRTPNPEDCLEGQLVESVAMVLPSGPEADVGEADTAPGEEGRETAER